MLAFSQSTKTTKAQIVFPERERIKTKKQLAEENKKKEDDAFKEKMATYYFSEDEVENKASFHEGEDKLNSFFVTNLLRNIAVENDAPVGDYKVPVHLKIDKEGILKEIQVLSKHGYGMEKESMRVIKLSMSHWKPAKLKNLNVNSTKKLVFTFTVIEKI